MDDMSALNLSAWAASRHAAERWLSRWRSSGNSQGGDVATFCVGPRCAFVRLGPGSEGPTGRLRLLGAEHGSTADLKRWGASKLTRGAALTLVLQQADRQTLVQDRPDVPDQELAQALRFNAAEAMDAEPETLLTAAVAMPLINNNQRLQALTIAAPLDVVRAQLDQLSQAGMSVRSVDVADSALRGMAVLSRVGDAGSIMLSVQEGSASIALIWNNQFCALRVLPLPSAGPGQEALLEEQLALQIQRTADQFERQASNLSVKHLLAALPLMPAHRRQPVCDGLPFGARQFLLSEALEGSAELLQRCDNDATLNQLACVAAARWMDTQPQAATQPEEASA